MKRRRVRIYGYDRSSGGYVSRDFVCTAALEDGRASETGGDFRRDGGSIRLMTRADNAAAPGAYASFDMEREEPDKETDYLVTAVRDNRRGGLPHWRLIVNGRYKSQR